MPSNRNTIDLRKVRGRSAELPRGQAQLPVPRKTREPLRAKRRRRRFIAFLALFPVLVSIAWGISYVSYLPRFNVSSVTVQGAKTVPSRLIELFAETKLYDGTHPFLSPDNMFQFNERSLAAAIEAYFPRLKIVTVSRQSMMATAATITVVERQPFALWCEGTASSSACYQMDDAGIIFAPEAASTSLPYVCAGSLSGSATSSPGSASFPIGETFAPGHMPGILALFQLLSQAGFSPTGVQLSGGEDFNVPLSQGFYLKASFGEDPGILVRNLQLTLQSDALAGKASKLEYVDLRFGDRVYYRFSGSTEASTTPIH